MSQEFYYVIHEEGGDRIVEYASYAPLLEIGTILNLTNITGDHNLVQVMQVDQAPEEGQGHTLVKVIVKPVPWPPGWHGIGNPI